MEREKLLTQLALLGEDAFAWQYDPLTRTASAQVGEYTLAVRKVSHRPGENGSMSVLERNNVNAIWSVKHERYADLIEETPAQNYERARALAVDFTRSHLLGEPEPQHID